MSSTAAKVSAAAAVRVIIPHPSTKQACIVGYLTPPDQDRAKALTACRQRLPEHMVPITLVTLNSLPVLPNGKVDHKALPEPDWDTLAEGEEYVAPRDAAEEKVAAAWQDVLQVERIGVHANFFSVGGTSLLAGMISFRVGEAFGVDASVALLLRHPTIAELAAKVGGLAVSGQGRQGIPGGTHSPEEKAAGVPLSFYQEQMVSLGMQGFQAYDQLFAYQVHWALSWRFAAHHQGFILGPWDSGPAVSSCHSLHDTQKLEIVPGRMNCWLLLVLVAESWLGLHKPLACCDLQFNLSSKLSLQHLCWTLIQLGWQLVTAKPGMLMLISDSRHQHACASCDGCHTRVVAYCDQGKLHSEIL